MSNDTTDEPFFSRWSRQKTSKQQPGKQPPAVTAPAVAEPPAAEESPEVDPATLPNVEDLTAESDISAFLRKGVPEALQKLALRRMWSLDPEIRDFVEMAENQFDFHAPGGIPGLFQELPAGTDVSVWLAQATQTVVREDPKGPSATELADPPVDTGRDHVAVQHETSAIAVEETTDALPTARAGNGAEDALSAAEPAEVAQIMSTAPAGAPPNETAPSRRRHGGALPA
jgi:hypothetical protein